MLSALHTYYLWALDLFIHVPFQLPFLEHTALAAILALGTSRTHCHLCLTNRPWAESRNPPPPFGIFVDHIFFNLTMYQVTFRWSADFLCMDKVTKGHRSTVPFTFRVV